MPAIHRAGVFLEAADACPERTFGPVVGLDVTIVIGRKAGILTAVIKPRSASLCINDLSGREFGLDLESKAAARFVL